MSIVTVIDQNTDREVPAFTATIAPWFKADNEDPGKLDASIREEFLDLAKIIQSGAAWTDEEAGELARFLGLTVLWPSKKGTGPEI